MKKIKFIIEKIIEGLLAVSGGIASIVILLIIVFLFKEGFNIFNSPEIQKGYVLCVNSQNNVSKITSKQIKDIFDHKILDWKDINNGDQEKIYTFRIDDIFSMYSEDELGDNYSLLPEKILKVISENKNIICFIPAQYLPKDKHIKTLEQGNIKWQDFFLGKEWMPTSTPTAQFGILPLVLGTLWVSIFAILIALPLGLGVAIYMAELANEKIRKILKPAIELLAGIPSVVYGFFGLVVMVPFIQKTFHLAVGETAFAGSLILAIMALPTIITIAEDAIKNAPKSQREASLALGATNWQTIYRVVIPYSISGITAAIVLGIGRAIGETMAVLMVTGNAAIIPHSLFQPVRTIPATIAAELGEAPSGGAHYQSLFLLGCILFIITIIISMISEAINKKNLNKGL